MTRDARDQLQRLRVAMGFVTSDQVRLERIDDRYEVVKEVAVGGMGKVYLVRDTRFETPEALVALKLVESRNPVLQDRLWREAHALLNLRKSRHVVPVYDVGRRGTDIYFTMRHVAGGTLRAWQAGKSLPEIVDAYLQAARGLSDAHARGIVHRDFKPDNVLVEGDEVLVADFGLAASLSVTEAGTDELRPGPAGPRNATLGGTLPYMAPEQLAGEPSDARTDQFAYCVALWEASAGCLPWQWKRREDQLEVMQQPPRTERALPGWLRRALLRGMSIDRSDRFPDMTKLAAQLERGRGRKTFALRSGSLVLGLVGALTLGMWISDSPRESCEHFVASIDEHWPRETELDDAARARVDALASRWRERAEQLCVDGLAPAPTQLERRCMTKWLVSLDAVLDASPHPDIAMEVLEGLQPSPSFCDTQRLDLDAEVQRELVLARVESMSGRLASADAALVRADVRAESLEGSAAELAHAELDLARVELLTRAHRPAEARAAYLRAERSTEHTQQPRAELLLAWARYLALEGSEADDVVAAKVSYAEGKGLLGVEPSPLASALLLETEGQVERGLGHLDASLRAFDAAARAYDGLERPLQAMRARQNAAAVLHQQDSFDAARTRYEQLLAGVPEGDRSFAVLNARFELADVIREQQLELLTQGGPANCAPVLAQLELVVAHAQLHLRIDALARGAQVVGELQCEVELAPWIERADALLPLVEDAQLRARVEVLLALALLFTGDPSSEPRVSGLLRSPEFRASEYFAPLAEAWSGWLVEQGRCDDLRTWLADPAIPHELHSTDCSTVKASTRP